MHKLFQILDFRLKSRRKSKILNLKSKIPPLAFFSIFVFT